ncbi:AAA family ATPase [Ectobacillus funiculus]|uniref:AAA family ATPase n=1 Tax=Ectobacillus funiculus TaxID=137993 RepID=UPI00397C61D4
MTTPFKIGMANYFRARFPFLYVSTWEEERVITEVKQIVQTVDLIKTPRTLFTWSVTEGLRSDGNVQSNDTKAPMKALEFIEKYREPAVFILKDFHIYFGGDGRHADYALIRKIRDLVTVLEKSTAPKNVVLLSPSINVPYELQKEITIVEYGLPSFVEIKEMLNKMIEANRSNSRIKINLTSEEEERLAKAALGLTLQEAENAFALALVSKGRLDIDSVESVLQEKQQIIKKTGVLEYIKSDPNMDDIGGLENIKRWLKKRNKSWLDSAAAYGLPAPKGVLLTGVPGCGKSLIAKSISSMWHLPLLKLDMGKIFNGIVGSSEENMRKAIATAEAISPSILWIDEIEKGLSGIGSSGDSGTSTRVFGALLTWMQEKTKPVFVIATANNIDSLPPELLRKGRFDEIFFVDLPTRKERMDIFKIHLSNRLKNPKVMGDFRLDDYTLEKLADLTETFIGAEIEQVVISALFEAFSEDRSLTFSDLEKVIRNMVPLSVTQSEQIRRIREWANIRAVAATPQEDRVEYNKIAEPRLVPQEGNDDEDIRSMRGGRTVDF